MSEDRSVPAASVPAGYAVKYHEDMFGVSYPRWSAIAAPSRKLGEFGSRDEALAACLKDARAQRRDQQSAPPEERPVHIPARSVMGQTIAVEWYDGPLTELRRVMLYGDEPMVEVETVLCRVTERLPYRYPQPDGADLDYPRVAVRFDEADLLRMLAVVRGQPITDFQDRVRDPNAVTEDD